MNKKRGIAWPLLGLFVPIFFALQAWLKQGSSSGWFPIVTPIRKRKDSAGDGAFLSSRDGGARAHEGYDILVNPGQPVFAPFNCKVVRVSLPYPDNPNYKGLLISGADYDVKIFYITPVQGIIGYQVDAGAQIGIAQDISKLYGGGMKPHIHLEVRTKDGIVVDPTPLLTGN